MPHGDSVAYVVAARGVGVCGQIGSPGTLHVGRVHAKRMTMGLQLHFGVVAGSALSAPSAPFVGGRAAR